MSMVLILAGATGAGKTTFAHAISHTSDNNAKAFARSIGIIPSAKVAIFSADQHFTQASGEYKFDPKQLPMAHQNCMKNFLYTAMYCSIERSGAVTPTDNPFFDKINFGKQSTPVIDEPDLLIVDNTNTNIHDISPYIYTTQALGLPYKILVFATRHSRGVHHVPAAAVKQMQDNCRAWSSKPPRSFLAEPAQLTIIGTDSGYRILKQI